MDLKTQNRWRVMLDNGEHVIKGKLGQVSLHGDNELDVWVCTWEPAQSDDWPKKAKQSEHRANRMEREGWVAKQHYDDGGLFIRPWADLDRACQYIGAKKRRQVTEAMRAQLTAMRGKKKSLENGGSGDGLSENGTEGPWNG